MHPPTIPTNPPDRHITHESEVKPTNYKHEPINKISRTKADTSAQEKELKHRSTGDASFQGNEYIRSARAAKGLTQQQAAEQIGICQSAYCRIETGSRSPSVKLAKKIARVLDIHWELLFEDEEA